jgi:hypothetical protein
MNKILDDAYNMLSWYRDKYKEHLLKTDEMQRRIDKLEEERQMLTEQVEALLQVIEATNEK